MSKFDFTMNLAAPAEKLIQLSTDYENLVNYSPRNLLKNIKIIEKNDNEITTEETLGLSSIKGEISQRSIHRKNSSNELFSKVITGPLKGSTVKILYEKSESGSKVSINADLKIPLKYKILSIIIRKYYKQYLTGMMFRLNTAALES